MTEEENKSGAQEATPKDIDDMTFREAMAELEEVVAKLESNDLELEDSLKAYERGIQLLTACKTRLTGAQQKVTELMGHLDAPTDDATTDTTLS
jgi:exodeoxyribonuclease VII small subunit